MPATRSKTAGPDISLLATEINYIIYAYLVDAGFEHAAYNLRSEARLDTSNYKKTYLKRHTLIDLLAKALLYVEVETHWREDGRSVHCTAPFSLLKKHVCATGSKRTTDIVPISVNQSPQPSTSDESRGPVKRKGAGKGRDNAAGKRSKGRRGIVEEEEDAEMEDVQPEPPRSLLRASTLAVVEHVNGNGNANTNQQRMSKLMQSTQVELLGSHSTQIFACAWHPQAPLLATGSKDASVCVWDAEPSHSLPRLYETYVDPIATSDITCLDWSSDGSMLATGSMDMFMRVWESTGAMHLHSSVDPSTPNNTGPLLSVRFSPSGRMLAACSLDGTVTVWNVKERRTVAHMKSHNTSCLDVDWRDDHTLATCGSDMQIVLCSLDPSPVYFGWRAHADEINQVRFNPRGNLVATCSDDGTSKIWEIPPLTSDALKQFDQSAQRLLVNTLNGHRKRIVRVMWSPVDERLLATSCACDSTARLWDIQTGECIRVIEGHDRGCFSACFSPDGRFFGSAGGDGSVFVISVQSGERVAEWQDQDNNSVFDLSCRLIDGRAAFAVCVGRQVMLLRL
ncbi:WD40 repeat-like protein [Auricularia subglabra TFB-10046 SS5]|nr:WD40 repeat-like protein [Auricularia subglabra TFB-10046 SS5]